jgi:glycosyltransferase involved in cell wall biosynthesis
MRILILTQKVDKSDPILGFFHRWIAEFAKHCESVTVVCLYKGEYSLPTNVQVFSLGKEDGRSRAKYLKNFYTYIWRHRNDYDAVFVHMNQIYVILGGLFWRLWRKKVILWYAHGHVSPSLRLAEKIVNSILTSSRQSCRLKSSKVKPVGHGIDVNLFKPAPKELDKKGRFIVTTAGRIAPVKKLEVLIEAIDIVRKTKKELEFNIYGSPQTSEEISYFKKLQSLINERGLGDVVIFRNSVSNLQMPRVLQNSDLFIQASQTGSLDKAVLEAVSVDIPAITANEAFKEVSGVKVVGLNAEEIAAAILSSGEISKGRQHIISTHSLEPLIVIIVNNHLSTEK